MEGQGRERDLVLAPNEYAMILDETKGHVTSYVGPTKTSLSNTDRPVILDEKTGKFAASPLERAIMLFPTADEGSYVILKNPAIDGEFPKAAGNAMTPKLQIGKKLNIKGPASFPLWPGQTAKVIDGHRLRSNQYLIIRVYNEEEASKNWAAAVSKSQEGADITPEKPKTLTIGQLLLIAGNEISFYIPPTGLEVVPDDKGMFIRDAVTLERLEYCILLEENGNKRFVQGPVVVFPQPTEHFMEWNGQRKFRAIELNENMGLYVKVIAEYMENGTKHELGEEMFIRGTEQKIYYPREEHAVIRYGDRTIHYAVAVPEGEARYVLNKITGSVSLKRGPCMLLPDPRNEVIVRRILDTRTVELWYPGNLEAQRINADLAGAAVAASADILPTYSSSRSGRVVKSFSGARTYTADEFARKDDFTPPKTITLDTKYEGACTINIWTGYAVQVVDKRGNRRVEVGPKTVLLEYDETLEVLTMSTGTPKTDDKVLRTVYLLSQNNKVSDIIQAETRDLVPVKIRTSYRVNFEGDENKWFSVENYVKLLTDHLRSMIRNVVKQHGVEEFNNDAIKIIRDTVLGPAEKRTGRVFEENDMRVYDVEVLDVTIGDNNIGGLLRNAQYDAVRLALQVAGRERERDATQRLESIKRSEEDAKHETAVRLFDLRQGWIAKDKETRDLEQASRLAEQKNAMELTDAQLEEKKAKAAVEESIAKQMQQLQLDLMSGETEAVVKRLDAIAPQIAVALNNFADKELTAKVAEAMAPLAIIGGQSVVDAINKMLKGTKLEGIMATTQKLIGDKVAAGKKDGS